MNKAFRLLAGVLVAALSLSIIAMAGPTPDQFTIRHHDAIRSNNQSWGDLTRTRADTINAYDEHLITEVWAYCHAASDQIAWLGLYSNVSSTATQATLKVTHLALANDEGLENNNNIFKICCKCEKVKLGHSSDWTLVTFQDYFGGGVGGTTDVQQ